MPRPRSLSAPGKLPTPVDHYFPPSPVEQHYQAASWISPLSIPPLPQFSPPSNYPLLGIYLPAQTRRFSETASVSVSETSTSHHFFIDGPHPIQRMAVTVSSRYTSSEAGDEHSRGSRSPVRLHKRAATTYGRVHPYTLLPPPTTSPGTDSDIPELDLLAPGQSSSPSSAQRATPPDSDHRHWTLEAALSSGEAVQQRNNAIYSRPLNVAYPDVFTAGGAPNPRRMGRTTRAPSPESPTALMLKRREDDQIHRANDRHTVIRDAIEAACGMCGKKQRFDQLHRLVPCRHLSCNSCISTMLSAVTVSRSVSRCGQCAQEVVTIGKVEGLLPGTPSIHVASQIQVEADESALYPVLRIDNVAWDITPEAVEGFLPPHVLPSDNSQPIHILLDRIDGRTKDYMYIEVIDAHAVHSVMQHCTNSFMPAGSGAARKRPVTITRVTRFELLDQLRPRRTQELRGLLRLCRAAVDPGSISQTPHCSTAAHGFYDGDVHYLKSRLGPFHALLSLLSNTIGARSPIYWDLFYLALGALDALDDAHSAIQAVQPLTLELMAIADKDYIMLQRLRVVFSEKFPHHLRSAETSCLP